ncbi:TetR/AcrR family transcriptional regulator [Mycobacterium sp. HNNTM2301]|uniref:TetR/AcrR family transcriptional regulator n=1 Tax=Mycobacterium hainanense TaxID=3289775 RepID=UPI0035A6F8FE
MVVDAALSILRSEGPEAITMRRVATALETGAASLYVYVSGREDLLELMLDRVISTVELEVPDPGRWREQLVALLERLHRALKAHRGIAAMTLADSPTTAAVLDLIENLMGILLAGGLQPQDAAWGCDLLISLVTATAREDDVRHPHDATAVGSRGDDLFATFQGLPESRFPLLVAHAAQMVAGDGQERFRFAIDVAIDGMLARARPGPSRAGRQRTRHN